MIRFAHPEYLYGLLLVPALVAFLWLSARLRRRSLARFGTPRMLGRLTEGASPVKRLWQATLASLALVFLVVAIANPQIGTRMEEVKQEGIDLFIALDVSLSMRAEDIKPSRLDKAKLELRSLIDRLAGDRIGLVVFAGDAFTQFPLTTDYSAANLFLDVVDVDAVSMPGTNIGAAITRGLESFDFEEPTTKVIVIITDGESTEGDAFEAAEEAAGKGVLIYAIGLGSPAGSPIPVYGAAGEQTDFKRDRQGNVVVSKLDEESLEKIAGIGSGKYFRASAGQDELEEIYKAINALEKREFGVKQFTDYEDRYQVFLLAALVLVVMEALLTEKRVMWLARWNLLGREEGAKG
jgi:Ca-activated chloride channel family protein